MSTALKWKIFVTPGHKRNRPAQVLWLQHRRHHFFRGRYRTLLHDGSCDLAGHKTACPEAVAALVHQHIGNGPLRRCIEREASAHSVRSGEDRQVAPRRDEWRRDS
jgi:hypothetical protein